MLSRSLFSEVSLSKVYPTQRISLIFVLKNLWTNYYIWSEFASPCPKLSNCVILSYHIISLKYIQQVQEKCYCTCEIHQSDGQIIC